jgi:peptidyl-prolyl cis-trans isomerase SurA
MPIARLAPEGLVRQGLVLSAVVMSSLAAGCGPRQPAAPPPPSADAWAVVDGREITGTAVEKAYRRTVQGAAPSNEEAMNAKLTLLNEMIVQDILVNRATGLKVEVPEADVDKAFNDAKKDIPDDAFQQELTKRNLTAADMREGLKRELIAQKVIQREVTEKVVVTDAEIAAFYEANRAQFNLPEDAYHIAQIVITPVREQQQVNRTGDDAASPEAAARKAQGLMERLKQGAQFSQLAADFSEDPQSAQRGGDMGLVPASALRQVPPALRDAVLKATPGTVNVVSSGTGVHTLVLLVAQEKAGQRDLGSPGVRDRITGTLRTSREQLLRTAYLSAARSEAKINNVIAKKVLETPGTLPSLGLKAPGTP